MQEQFDKRLADKIRKELADYEPPFESQNWTDMKARLNGNTTTNGYKKYIVAVLLLLAVGVAYIPFGDIDRLFLNKANNQSESKDDKASILADKNNSTNTNKQIEANKIDSDTNQSPTASLEYKIPKTIQDSFNTNSSQNKEEILASKIETNDKRVNGTNEFVTGENQFNDNKSSENKISKNQQGLNFSETINNGKETALISDSDIEKNYDYSDKQLSDKNTGLFLGEVPSSKNVDSSVELNEVDIDLKDLNLLHQNQEYGLLPVPESEKVNLKNDVSFSIIATGFVNNNNRVSGYKKTGFGLGALVNFLPQKRFNFSTGLIVKNLNSKSFPDQSGFEADEAGFAISARPSLNAESFADIAESNSEKTELITVEAELLAIEIPLNVSFNLYSGRGKRLFISTGASSYFYISENYNFEKEKFDLPSSSNIRKLSIVNETLSYGAFRHFDLFSSIMLSAGVEKRTGLKSSVTIEPFMQLPIRKMGNERVPVYSTGLMLKYNFGN